MTEKQFLSDIREYRRQITSRINLNAESPKRVQFLIEEILDFLSKLKFEGTMNERVKVSKKYLKEAHKTAEAVSGNLLPDVSTSYDLAVKYDERNNLTWSLHVIGTAEAAMDVIIDYLTDNE